MSIQVREAFAWFITHIAWGVFSTFLLYPFFVAPLQMSYIADHALPASEARPVFLATALIVGVASYILTYFAFLGLRSALGAGRPTQLPVSEF